MADEYTFPKADGDILYDGDVNLIQKDTDWIDITFTGDNSDTDGLLVYSPSRWETNANITTDTGASWSAGGWGDTRLPVHCEGTAANAIAYVQGTGQVDYTTDSGATWSSASASPSNVTSISGGSYRVSGMAVLWGVASSGKGLWYSTDQGDNWTQATDSTLTTTMLSCDMKDANDGVAIDSGYKILYTTSGMSGWTDSTDVVTTTSSTGCFNTYVINSGASQTDYDAVFVVSDDDGSNSADAIIIQTWDGATTTKRYQNKNTNTRLRISNVIKTTNGNFYFAAQTNDPGGTNAATGRLMLYRSTDDGITWSMKSLGMASDTVSWALQVHTRLDQVGGVLYMIDAQGAILKIDESEVQ